MLKWWKLSSAVTEVFNSFTTTVSPEVHSFFNPDLIEVLHWFNIALLQDIVKVAMDHYN